MPIKSPFVLFFFFFFLFVKYACEARPLKETYKADSRRRVGMNHDEVEGGKTVTHHHHQRRPINYEDHQMRDGEEAAAAAAALMVVKLKEVQVVPSSSPVYKDNYNYWHNNVDPAAPMMKHPKTGIDFFSDYSKPRMRPPSHN